MSRLHNTPSGERKAMRFHYFCAGIGLLHVAIGGAMIWWHAKGANDHKLHLQDLTSSLR